MKRIAKLGVAPLAAAVALTALGGTPARAFDPEVIHMIAEVQRITPRCEQHPEYRVVGRVAGRAGSPSRNVSFVGCFPSFAACDNWRGPVSGKISGRLSLSTCEPRR